MAEVDHPLWEAAIALYSAWVKGQGLVQMLAPQLRNASEDHQTLWLGIAQVAKDLFGEYQDDLVAQLERVYAIVRDEVSATKWEKISRKIAGCEEGFTEGDEDCVDELHNRHYHPVESGMAAAANLSGGLDGIADHHRAAQFRAGQRVFLDGVPFPAYEVAAAMRKLPGQLYYTLAEKPNLLFAENRLSLASEVDDAQAARMRQIREEISHSGAVHLLRSSSTLSERYAHARIDALQREVCYQLNQLWTIMRSEVAGSPPSIEVAQDRYNSIWGALKGADYDVEKKLGLVTDRKEQ